MKRSPMKLPWTSETVPHAILDILRGCNIKCRDCYNSRPDQVKKVSEVEAELDSLMRLRRLQSVSIVGGEITMHPDLVEIVRRVRQRGLFVELFTNGLDLNARLLGQLKEAGANVIFLHVEPHQRRDDLPADAAGDGLKRLRSEKAELVAAHGIEVGLSITAYPDRLQEVDEAIDFTLESPRVCYLLVTWWRDVGAMPAIRGDLRGGLFPKSPDYRARTQPKEISPRELSTWMQQRFGLSPFAFLGSNIDAADPRWLSFMVGAVHLRAGELAGNHSLRPTWMERFFMEVSRRVTGRYPFYQQQGPWHSRLHLLLNGLAGGAIAGNLSLLALASRPGARLSAKRLLFQWPAAIDESGRVVHCYCCPDAVLSQGRLVPLCISDRVATGEPAGKLESLDLVGR